MVFVRNLHDIYHDIFKLVGMGFSAEYIESISPSERDVFKYYNSIEDNELATEDNISAANEVGLDIGDLI